MIKIKLTKTHRWLSLVALIIGLLSSIVIFNFQQDQLIQFDVTWNSPQEAMIFWKTSVPTKSYVKYGLSRWRLNQTQAQLNENESELHVVILSNLPQAEIFISLHNETDGFFRWPQVMSIKYELNLDESS